MQKCIFMILDGLGDLPVAELGGKTPLEAACTPTLDLLASTGVYGQVDPIGQDVTPNTHSGAGILLGLEPGAECLMDRGPVEAAGAGRYLKPGEVALRVNFASIHSDSDTVMVTDRRAGRISDGVEELAATLNQIELGDGIVADFRPTDQHRGVLILSGDDLDAAITDTDPGDTVLPAKLLKCQALNDRAIRTAVKVNSYLALAHERLKDHPQNAKRIAQGKLPANGVITRGAGAYVSLPNVIQQSGLSGVLISACNTVKGLGRIFDFEIIEDQRFTADVHTDVAAKIERALEALNLHDVAFVHIKAPDICAHDRQALAKRDFLERVDLAMSVLLKRNLVVAVTADHTTDSNTGMHTADPVPSLLNTRCLSAPPESVKFGESACRTGTMQRQTSAMFLQQVLSAMNINRL